jgi:hypothetical protein
MQTFSESTQIFIDRATWLTEDDAPAVVTLLALAAELDANLNPPLVAQYGLTYRNLLKRKPVEIEEVDELAKLLRR